MRLDLWIEIPAYSDLRRSQSQKQKTNLFSLGAAKPASVSLRSPGFPGRGEPGGWEFVTASCHFSQVLTLTSAGE